MTKQKQISGDNSTNIQANEIVVYQQGLSYSEVREVAKDIFRQNFDQLSVKAMETAYIRAEEITEKFFNKLLSENPLGLLKAEDPDFQSSLLTVQKEYAINGDKDLGDLLVDLLVDRSKCEQRDILQIVLNESLKTAPKLTDDQLAVLSIIFFFRDSVNSGIGNHIMLGEYFDMIFPFVEKLTMSASCYRHLEFSGCGSNVYGETLEKIIGKKYKGLFLNGFDDSEIGKREISVGIDSKFFVACLNDSSKLQIRALNNEDLQKKIDSNSVTQDDSAKIFFLFDKGKMTATEIRDKCIEIRPFMKKVFKVWNESLMRSFNLTSVGIAIGHANIKRFAGEFANLSIWIH